MYVFTLAFYLSSTQCPFRVRFRTTGFMQGRWLLRKQNLNDRFQAWKIILGQSPDFPLSLAESAVTL